MSWQWVVVWAALLLASAAYLGARVVGLWGRLKELGAELEVAQRRVDTLQEALDTLGEGRRPAVELAVFERPGALRATRDRVRADAAAARRARRAANRPGWAGRRRTGDHSDRTAG